MIVELNQSDGQYPDLTPGQPYLVLGIEADDLRILNDQGKPYLYPPSIFKILDAREPQDWVTEIGQDKERYAYPPLLNDSGFFEDYFDGKSRAIATFWQVMNRRLAAAA